MRIPITCGSCGRDFSAPDTHIGRKVVCPDCGTGVKVRSSGIATPRESEDDVPQSGTRRARGGGPSPKVILGIFGAVAAIAAAAVVMQNLPDLSQINSVVVTPPLPQASPANPAPAGQAGEAGPQPKNNNPDATPAIPVPEAIRPPEAELEAKRKREAEINQAPTNQVMRSSGDAPGAASKSTRPGQHHRTGAEDEVDTDRGQRLLGRMRSVVLVREGARNDRSFDPRGLIWKRVTDRYKAALEKVGMKFSTGSPGSKSAVLKVAMKGKPSPVGTPGTQEITLSAELICFDSQVKGGGTPYASVWKQEDSVGTIARNAIRSKRIPEKLDRNLGDFVNRFRVACQQAAKAATMTPEEAQEVAEDDTDNLPEIRDNEEDDSADAAMEADAGGEDDTAMEAEQDSEEAPATEAADKETDQAQEPTKTKR